MLDIKGSWVVGLPEWISLPLQYIIETVTKDYWREMHEKKGMEAKCTSLAALLFVSIFSSPFFLYYYHHYAAYLLIVCILQSFVSSIHCLNEYGAYMFVMEKREEDMKTKVNGLKNTLSGE